MMVYIATIDFGQSVGLECVSTFNYISNYVHTWLSIIRWEMLCLHDREYSLILIYTRYLIFTVIHIGFHHLYNHLE